MILDDWNEAAPSFVKCCCGETSGVWENTTESHKTPPSLTSLCCFAQRFENHVAVNQPVEELNFKGFTIHNLHSLQPAWVAHMLEAKDARRSAPTITCEKHETSCGKTLSKSLGCWKIQSISRKMGNQLDLEANARWVSGNHLSLHQLCLLFGRVPVSFVCYRSLHSCCTFRFAASSGMAASSSSKQILRATGCFAYAAVLVTTNNQQVWGRTQGFIVWKLTQGVLEPLSVLANQFQ